MKLTNKNTTWDTQKLHIWKIILPGHIPCSRKIFTLTLHTDVAFVDVVVVVVVVEFVLAIFHDIANSTTTTTLIQTKPKYKMRSTPNRWHPPPTAQTAEPIGLIFLLGVHQRHRIGVTVAIFEFPSQTLKNRPPTGSSRHPPETKKMEKKFF